MRIDTDSIVCDDTSHNRDADGFCIQCGKFGAENLDTDHETRDES